jgi:hypothetical protein
MSKKTVKVKNEVLSVEDAFLQWRGGEHTKPTIINFNDRKSLPANSQVGFKLYKKKYRNYTLEVYYNGVTLILPKVNLELSHTSTVTYDYSGATEVNTTDTKPIAFEIETEQAGEALVIMLFGAHIILDYHFQVVKLSDNVYQIEHIDHPKTYVHQIKCKFSNVISNADGWTWGQSYLNFHAMYFPDPIPERTIKFMLEDTTPPLAYHTE